MMQTEASSLDYGAEYARCFGWKVLPLHYARRGACSCGKVECESKGKHPHWDADLLPSGVSSASGDRGLIAKWAALWPNANVGIATGVVSGIVVIDIDPRHGGDDNLADLEREYGKLPDTVTALTGGGGRHYYFRYPGEHVKNRTGEDAIRPGVEVKGDGGYVVAPPSMHGSGVQYYWEVSSQPGEVPLVDMPEWLLTLLRTEPTVTPGDDEPIKKIYKGARNSRLTSLAGTMRRRGMSESAILAALLVVNEESCVPPLGEREVAQIAHSVARYKPEDECPTLIIPRGGTDCARWLDRYVEYATSISPMTPKIFHESGGLWLLSTAVARRLVLPMAHGAVFPNLYIMWLAPTTLYRKTTGQAVPRAFADKLFPYLLAPQDCTPEAMLNDMAGAEPPNLVSLSNGLQEEWRQQRNFAAQRGMVMDEMSGILATAGRDYNAGLLEGYLRFYDCEKNYKRSTRSQGLQVVRNAYVSILGASTPGAMAQHMTAARLWAMGWWARFAILTPDEGEIEWRKPTLMEEPPEIMSGLMSLLSKLPKGVWPNPAEAVAVDIVPEAQETWETYNQKLSFDYLKDDGLDERFYGTYGRMPTQALKVAMLLAAVDWAPTLESPVIETRHLMRAISITEQWRASAHRAVKIASESEYEGLKRRVLRQMALAGTTGASMREICRGMQDVKPSKVEETVNELILAGDIESIEKPTGPRGGRPTVRYCLVTE